MGSAEPARAARIHRRLPEPVDVVAIVSTAGSAGPPIGTAVGDGSAGLAGVGTGAGAGSVIRDVVEFRRSGLAYRPVAELNILVQAWRAAMRHAGRRADTLVHTFLGPPHLATPADRETRWSTPSAPIPHLVPRGQRLLWWRRVDQLDMLVDTFARGDPPTRSPGRWSASHFLAPPACPGPPDPPGQLVFAVMGPTRPGPGWGSSPRGHFRRRAR